MAMKIVHFADLHLDAQFAWAAAHGDAARKRRQALRDTLSRIVSLTQEVSADALLCGGDLYEHERFTPDTAEFLRATFAELDPTPVYIAPGNHDWYGPESLYRRVAWSPNVHIFRTDSLEPVALADGVTLWGAAHLVPANTRGFLDDFHVEGEGTHLALFHGSEDSWFTEQGEGKAPHAPFRASQIGEAGLDHAFLGHFHKPRHADHHTYSGNPDPLAFGEDGERGAVIATIHDDRRVTTEVCRVAVTAAHDLLLDVTNCTTQQEIRDRLAQAAAGLDGIARITVSGELISGVDVRIGDLNGVVPQFDAVQVRVGEVRTGYDIDAIRQERTVRGQFVNDVTAEGLPVDEERRVLLTGLRALDGRPDLEVI